MRISPSLSVGKSISLTSAVFGFCATSALIVDGDIETLVTRKKPEID